MQRFPAATIDLSTLPRPNLIQTVDFEAIVAAQKADIVARFAASGITFDTTVLESETSVVMLEATAYREVILRSLVNATALQTLLAFASGNDLDHIGARFGVLRAPALGVTTPRGDPSTYPMDWESDTRFRVRIQLAPDAYSNAGTLRGYQFHVMSASIEIADVYAFSPTPGRVDLVCLGASGPPSDAAIQAVYQRVMSVDVKPLTDDVRVTKALVVPYTASAVIQVPTGPDPAAIYATALQSVQSYAYPETDFTQASPVLSFGFGSIGRVHTTTGIIGALQVPNVIRTILSSPAADIDPGPYGVAQASFNVTTQVLSGGPVIPSG